MGLGGALHFVWFWFFPRESRVRQGSTFTVEKFFTNEVKKIEVKS